ncbi:MAG: TfoX/Sxy family protein [Deltaproteobacteria bacterium]|nr:TfoX/Sxy family protein [Deltaproteobacteria bacterium]
MAYDHSLAARVREALRHRSDVVEKVMFGGIAFMVRGNMCCGVNRNELIIRLDAHTEAEDLGSPHARPWDFMKRPMPGMFAVGGAGCDTQPSLEHWVELALKHAISLPSNSTRPPKRTSAGSRGRK